MASKENNVQPSKKVINHVQLSRVIIERFNLDEIHHLCFTLMYDYEELGEGGKSTKSIELVTAFERNGRLYELAETVKELRPDVTWEELGQPDPIDLNQKSGQSPYKGLAFFDTADADQFYGRNKLTAEIINHLNNPQQFLAVIGASGSGKSSIVRAGLIPVLTRNKIITPAPQYPMGSENWLIKIITPTANPLQTLANNLTNSVNESMKVQKLYEKQDNGLDFHVRFLTQKAKAKRLLLVVDQFEELFTQCQDEAIQKTFIANLLTATQGSTIVIITLRADFYDRCSENEQLRQLLSQSQIYIGAMNQQELRQAIEMPAQRFGWKLEEGLVDLLLEDAGSERGALPLLSHALLETWKRREGLTMTLTGYIRSGGIRGAIAKTADDVFNQLSATEKVLARRIFIEMTEVSENAPDTRRRINQKELRTKNKENTQQIEDILEKLTQARLIIKDEDSVEVSHEALIREWPTLRRWLDEDREGLWIRRDLREAAKKWEGLQREPEALYRGTELLQAQEWAKKHSDQVDSLELNFLNASQEAIDAVIEKERNDRERELEINKKIAQTEKQRREAETLRADQERESARRLRLALGFMIVLLILTIGATGFAVWAGNKAQRSADAEVLAKQDAQTREAEAIQAVNAQGTAVANFFSASTAEAAAKVSAQESAVQAQMRADEAATAAALEIVARQDAQESAAEAQRQADIAATSAALEIAANQAAQESAAEAQRQAAEAAAAAEAETIARAEAQKNELIARSQALSAEAQNVKSDSLDLALLLSVEAYNNLVENNLDDNPLGKSILLQTITFEPHLVAIRQNYDLLSGSTLAQTFSDYNLSLQEFSTEESNPYETMRAEGKITQERYIGELVFSDQWVAIGSCRVDPGAGPAGCESLAYLWQINEPVLQIDSTSQCSLNKQNQMIPIENGAFNLNVKSATGNQETKQFLSTELQNIAGTYGIEIHDYEISPDGKVLATAVFSDRFYHRYQIILWDIQTGLQLGNLIEGSQWGPLVDKIGFLNNGSQVMVCFTNDNDSEGKHMLLDANPVSWQNHACEVAGRNMTQEEWGKYMGNKPYKRTCPQY